MVGGPPKHWWTESELSLADSPYSPNDETLVRSALAGDTGAFDRLVERYAPRMFRMIRAEVGDASEAEDLVQETFLRAFIALPKFRFGARFYTWLYRIMVNTVKQYQRNSARRRRVLDAKVHDELSGGGMTADAFDASMERKEAREKVWRALANLPEEYRAATLLREWEGLTYSEIAQILGCPIGTVASRIARARQMLAERLAPE